MMLTEKEVKALLVVRIKKAAHSCNSYHINHVKGQVRALVAVLTGEIPPSTDDVLPYLDAAKIPYSLRGDSTFGFESEWLEDHGFILDPEDENRINHPKFGDW